MSAPLTQYAMNYSQAVRIHSLYCMEQKENSHNRGLTKVPNAEFGTVKCQSPFYFETRCRNAFLSALSMPKHTFLPKQDGCAHTSEGKCGVGYGGRIKCGEE